MCLAALFFIIEGFGGLEEEGESGAGSAEEFDFSLKQSFAENERRGCVFALGTGTEMDNKFPIFPHVPVFFLWLYVSSLTTCLSAGLCVTLLYFQHRNSFLILGTAVQKNDLNSKVNSLVFWSFQSHLAIFISAITRINFHIHLMFRPLSSGFMLGKYCCLH